MITVKVKNGNINGAIRAFSNAVYESGIMLELKDRMYFKTKSEKKKAKKERNRLLEEAKKKSEKQKKANLNRYKNLEAEIIKENKKYLK